MLHVEQIEVKSRPSMEECGSALTDRLEFLSISTVGPSAFRSQTSNLHEFKELASQHEDYLKRYLDI